MAIGSYARELTSLSKQIKEVRPEVYQNILALAAEEWGTDMDMICYTVNKQTKAYYDFIQAYDKTNKQKQILYINSLEKWCDDIDLPIGEMIVDWSMALYEYNKQLEALEALQ